MTTETATTASKKVQDLVCAKSSSVASLSSTNNKMNKTLIISVRDTKNRKTKNGGTKVTALFSGYSVSDTGTIQINCFEAIKDYDTSYECASVIVFNIISNYLDTQDEFTQAHIVGFTKGVGHLCRTIRKGETLQQWANRVFQEQEKREADRKAKKQAYPKDSLLGLQAYADDQLARAGL